MENMVKVFKEKESQKMILNLNKCQNIDWI